MFEARLLGWLVGRANEVLAAAIAVLSTAGLGNWALAQSTADRLAESGRRTANAVNMGAVGDGFVDDTTAIRAAIASLGEAGGILAFPPGTYRISSELRITSAIEIACTDATIRSDQAIESYFRIINARNVAIHGCTFDQNSRGLPVYADRTRSPRNVALNFDAGSGDMRVYDNAFVDLDTNAIRLYHTVGDLYVANNLFSSGQQKQMLHLEHVQIVTASGHLEISGNKFLNAPVEAPSAVPGCIFISGTKGTVVVDGNFFDYCGRDNTGAHRVGVVDFYGNSENIRVAGNVSTNTMGQFLRLAASWPAYVTDNTVKRHRNASSEATIMVAGVDNFVGLGRVGARDVELRDNLLEATGIENYGITISAYDYAFPLAGIRIERNTLTNFRIAIGLAGPYEDAVIEHNDIVGTDWPSLVVVWTSGYGATIKSEHGVGEAQSRYGDISLSNNTFSMPAFRVTPLVIDLRKSPAFSADVGTVAVLGNKFQLKEGSEAAIAAHTGPGPAQGTLVVHDNLVVGARAVVDTSGFQSLSEHQNVLLRKQK